MDPSDFKIKKVSSFIHDVVIADLMKHCSSRKFCFNLGSTAFDTCALKRDFSANTMMRTQTFEWFSVIRLWENLVED
jgi:hypothetical protein